VTEPARILFLSAYSGLGGGETSLLNLMGALDRRRFAPALVCPREGLLPQRARALDVRTTIVPYRGASIWFVPQLWARLPAARRLAHVLAETAPQVVHSDFHSLPFAAPACRAAGLPLIFTCYGWWFQPKPWQRGFYRHGGFEILAICDAVRRGFLGNPPFMPADRVTIVPLGVDTSVYRPRPSERIPVRRALGLPEEGPLVTLVGRFQTVKGHDVFLAAAKLVAAAMPDACFAMVGENAFGVAADEAFKKRVIARVEGDSILRAHVHLLGWIDRPEHVISASDVVVCSSHFESFGMALVEAMSCGVPVVSTNVGGPSETVADGVTGFLVPPRRPDALADRTLELLRDAPRRQAMGQAGRARVEAHFSVARYSGRFQEIASGAMAARGATVE
jgi:glycosyltransferase involved in cell wall biosynthesis